MASLVAAGVAAGGVGAKAAFEYNRENFFYDRILRRRMEFQMQKFRVTQAELWRADVRDLISLTEYKMHVYLLTNALLLGFTIILFCEGRLPEHTPIWMMEGYMIAIAGGFMFVLLSVFMAIQAAVAAQSYEARLLTTMVRLPIPTWQEIEACRTYASEYEQLEARQMFRVPFLTGRQEGLVRGQPADERAGPRPGAAGASRPPTEAASGGARQRGTSPERPSANSDPWGLERRGENIPELGCATSSEVARLRHVRLTRHAMGTWQSYDAFARVSLSVGVMQLLLAMSYFAIGYIMVDVGCRTACIYAVVLFTFMSESICRLDISLQWWQFRFLQVTLLLGPLLSVIAAFHWSLLTKSTSGSRGWAEALITIAFVMHALFLMLMLHFFRIRQQDNGAKLPVAFRSVLYLDAFGWVSAEGQGDEEAPSAGGISRSMRSIGQLGRRSTAFGGRSGRQLSPGAGRSRGGSRDTSPVAGAGETRRPALAAVQYANGRPEPCRPEDLAPEGVKDDMRDEPGAPQLGGSADDTFFFEAASWLRRKKEGETGDEALEEEDDLARAESPFVTGHEKEPKLLPFRVFQAAVQILYAAWTVAAVSEAVKCSNRIRGTYVPVGWQAAPVEATGGHSLLSLSSGLSFFSDIALQPGGLEEVSVVWPHPGVVPRSFACDASGRTFVATDGLVLFEAEIRGDAGEGPLRRQLRQPAAPLSAVFTEASCPALLGENLQDAAVVCPGGHGDEGGTCQALVLHRHGGRLAACSLSSEASEEAAPGLGATGVANVSDAWLERLRVAGATARGDRKGGAHGRFEKAVSIALDNGIDGECADLGRCALLGTTQGRVVELRRRQHAPGAKAAEEDEELVPAEVLRDGGGAVEGAASLGPGALRVLSTGGDGSPQHLGLLQPGGRSISVLDGRTGAELGHLSMESSAPVAAAFCAGGGHLYLMDQGPSPKVFRVPLPSELHT